MSTTEPKTTQTPTPSERPGLLYALSKLFIVLAFFPVVLMIPGTVGDDYEALQKAAARMPIYGWTAIGLASVSGLLLALHKLRLAKKTDGGESRK